MDMTRLLVAIGDAISADQQVWLTAHLAGLPDFLETPEGKSIVSLAVESYQQACTVTK